MFWRLSSSQRSLAVRHIKRIHSVSLAASVQNDAAPTAFVARFAQKTLRALSTESRAPSPAPHIITDQNEDSSFQIDLVSLDLKGRSLTLQDEFLRSANLIPDTTQQDEQYW